MNCIQNRKQHVHLDVRKQTLRTTKNLYRKHVVYPCQLNTNDQQKIHSVAQIAVATFCQLLAFAL